MWRQILCTKCPNSADILQFGGSLLGTAFKEQSRHWEDIVLSHVSDAIRIVHQFILDLLDHVFADEQVKSELYDNVLLEKLQASYKQAMDHAMFLLKIERDSKPMTLNHYFNAELQKAQSSRLHKAMGALPAVKYEWEDGPVVRLDAIMSGLSVNKSNPEQVREYLHDILKSYYKVSEKRFVDVVCQHVINHYLLIGEDSPLHIFTQDLVFNLDARALENIAGEDMGTKQEREKLSKEIGNLQDAMKVLRGA